MNDDDAPPPTTLAFQCLQWATDLDSDVAERAVCPFVLGPAAAAAAMITYLQLVIAVVAAVWWWYNTRGGRARAAYTAVN